MFRDNLCYEASAGSGKTFMLVVRYLSLLFKGADPSKILALTFTNKAAYEMSQRIVETLEELESRDELFEIAKVTEFSIEEILSSKERVLEIFLNANTRIMTIDSFFTQILRKFSLYASLMPDFTTFSSQHELKLLSRFLKEVSVANKRETLIALSLESKKRLSDIFILLNEFYEKKEELSTLRFEKMNNHSYKEEAMEALRLLQGAVKSCKGASATLLEAVEADSFEVILKKSWLFKESLEYWVFKKCFSLEMNQYLHTIQNAAITHFRVKESNFFNALNELARIYKKSKKALYMEDSELSFSDVTSLVYEILHLLNDSEFLYFRLDATIEHILLDEFQDTSIVQYEILKPLIREITSGEGVFSRGSFFFVGDVKQSIYRFRGGVSALFSEVAKQNAMIADKLFTNYRSQKEIVNFVNALFENRMKAYTPQLVREEANEGYVEIVKSDTLLEATIEQVERLIFLGATLDDIAILCATNGDGEEIKLALQEKKIEVVTETTTKLINQKSVKALLEYLKYLKFGENIYSENFFALINKEVTPITRIDLNRYSLLEIVKKAISIYGLFSDDFHLIRFLDTLRRYDDIEALLFEYERLDVTAAASDISGVRVLTVHKSKGLEYEHVIVMDRLKGVPPARGSIIFEYDGIRLQNIHLRTKNRELLDSTYANALEKEQKLVTEDRLNSLYVAFTRARENLFIIAKSEKSDFALLELEVAQKGRLIVRPKEHSQSQALEPLYYKELYYGTQSDILALEKEKSEELQALHFGTALHYALEMLGSFEIESIYDAIEIMRNKYGFLLQEGEMEDITQRLQALVNDNTFLELVDGVCYREKSLRLKQSLRYIDLLVKHKSGVYYVIDYKSSLYLGDEHKKQVRGYVNAIKEITKERVEGYICYLLDGSIRLVKVHDKIFK